MTQPILPLKPRKQPVQRRSAATVEALHTATIQVLTREGLTRCTTTRVAERAGVSVGSIYQYYPNRDALLASVLEQHLGSVMDAVLQACRDQAGKTVCCMASHLVAAYLAAKLHDPEESRALYAVAGELGGPDLVAKIQAEMIGAIAAMLDSAVDAHFVAPEVTAAMVLHAMAGPVVALLNGKPPEGYPDALEDELVRLISAYLMQSAAS